MLSPCTMRLYAAHGMMVNMQADTPWRKVAAKLEGEPAYEELDKVDRVEVYAEYIR